MAHRARKSESAEVALGMGSDDLTSARTGVPRSLNIMTSITGKSKLAVSSICKSAAQASTLGYDIWRGMTPWFYLHSAPCQTEDGYTYTPTEANYPHRALILGMVNAINKKNNFYV